MRSNPSERRVRSRGFSLVELLIIMNVMAILMAIAIPNYVVAKKTANERAALQNLRQLETAQEMYRNRQSPPRYADTYAKLVAIGYVTGALATTKAQGYQFSLVGTPDENTFTFTAAPIALNSTGDRYFWVDQTGVLRMNMTSNLSTASPIQ